MQEPSAKDVPPGVMEMLKPEGKKPYYSHADRLSKLFGVTDDLSLEFGDSPFFSMDAVRDTFEGTQFLNENHRRLTPYIQELFRVDRAGMMANIDDFARTNFITSGAYFDVVIIGSGPHGSAVAADLREKFPQLTTLILEQNEKLGGQFRSYGPKPAFAMNSRVRKADRREPGLPRMKGSINPLGRFAPLELSDFVTTSYAMNTDMGDACAVNAHLSATMCLTNCKVTKVEIPGREVTFTRGSRRLTVTGSRIIDARGLQYSFLTVGNPYTADDGYFTPASFYSHFGNDRAPLARFAGQNVAVIGAGDSALTVIEALIGNLPHETYGSCGVGRLSPKRIMWMGAPGTTRQYIESCLRARYKNGILQAIPRQFGEESLILPSEGKVRNIELDDRIWAVRTRHGDYSFPNIVVDCAASVQSRDDSVGIRSDNMVGANVPDAEPRPAIRAKLNELDVPENNVALWATMPRTTQVALSTGVEITGKEA